MKRSLTQTAALHKIIALLLILTFASCKEDAPKADAGLNQELNFNEQEYYAQFRESLLREELFHASHNPSLQFFDTLKSFFTERNYQPLFINSFEEKEFIDSVVNLFEKAHEHGINPKLYYPADIKKEFASALQDKLPINERYKHLTKTEILVSDAILKYAYHLRYGILNPKEVFADDYFLPVVDSSKRNLFEPLKQDNISRYLVDIQPKSKKYLDLQAALKKFEGYKNHEWQKINFTVNKKIKAGDSDSSVTSILKRLAVLGFLDSSKISTNANVIYDSTFTDAVKNFQNANGLISDGEINKNIVDKLNITPDEYINKIKINLERFRWNNYSDTSRYILVNIPEFRLHAMENGKEVFDITVCTGRKRSEYVHQIISSQKTSKRKSSNLEDWETPTLYSYISHLVLNPTWTVPFSIMREEIASKVRRDSTYLKRANFRVYKNGSQISPTEVKVSELSTGSSRYTIIQNPGAGNALGKIKFMFDNPFGVYLHDTPTRPPFKYANRAVSHGCVRVEKPLVLADYLLKNNSTWTLDYLKVETNFKVDDESVIKEFRQKRNELRKGASYGATTEVKLINPIPLFIDYFTAWVDRNGIVNFRDDVYRKDKIIGKYLFK